MLLLVVHIIFVSPNSEKKIITPLFACQKVRSVPRPSSVRFALNMSVVEYTDRIATTRRGPGTVMDALQGEKKTYQVHRFLHVAFVDVRLFRGIPVLGGANVVYFGTQIR